MGVCMTEATENLSIGVVTKYKGDGLNKPASDFTCADPWTGTFVPLDKATCFNKITQYVVFK